MINIIDKNQCCGCGACSQICPDQCIEMKGDEQGFLYPFIDLNKCLNCNLCEKKCPFINPKEKEEPLSTYAAWHKNDSIRIASSSGGVFSAVAINIIKQGGVVFGAKFNEQWEVVHDYAESIEELSLFRGSKYVQSVIGNCYEKCEHFLKQGRTVLFTGTPCQIAGLNSYLRKTYNNLVSVEVACHGVPSPLVWKEYLKSLDEKVLDRRGDEVKQSLSDTSNILDVTFRDKRDGWKKFGFSVKKSGTQSPNKNSVLSQINKKEDFFEYFFNNRYMKAFLRNLTIRPSCFDCKSKDGHSGCDLTIADYWGIEIEHPELYDDKGVSLVMAFSTKGENLLKSIPIELFDSNYETAVSHNIAITNSVPKPKAYDYFWKVFSKKNIIEALDISIKKNQKSRFLVLLSRIKHKILSK